MTASSKEHSLRQQHSFHLAHAEVTDPLFGGGDFFDPRDLLQVKCEMLRRVLVERRPVAPTAHSFGLCRTSFYEARGQWQRGGLAALLPQRCGPQGPHKLTPEVIVFLENAGGSAAPGGPAALAAELWRQRDVRIHPRTIERAFGRHQKGGPPPGGPRP
jgi:hypothetical protein